MIWQGLRINNNENIWYKLRQLKRLHYMHSLYVSFFFYWCRVHFFWFVCSKKREKRIKTVHFFLLLGCTAAVSYLSDELKKKRKIKSFQFNFLCAWCALSCAQYLSFPKVKMRKKMKKIRKQSRLFSCKRKCMQWHPIKKEKLNTKTKCIYWFNAPRFLHVDLLIYFIENVSPILVHFTEGTKQNNKKRKRKYGKFPYLKWYKMHDAHNCDWLKI